MTYVSFLLDVFIQSVPSLWNECVCVYFCIYIYTYIYKYAFFSHMKKIICTFYKFKPNFSESVYMCIYHTNLSSPSLGSWLYHFIDIYPTASGSVVKKPPDNARDMSLIRGLGRSPGEGNGNPLQYSCLGNFVDRWAWQPTVHGVIKSQTRLSN